MRLGVAKGVTFQAPILTASLRKMCPDWETLPGKADSPEDSANPVWRRAELKRRLRTVGR
jgi:hypothetical protein